MQLITCGYLPKISTIFFAYFESVFNLQTYQLLGLLLYKPIQTECLYRIFFFVENNIISFLKVDFTYFF